MTKEKLQKELQEKVKPGIKPSQLKRSKSTGDLDDKNNRIKELEQRVEDLTATKEELLKNFPNQEIFYEASEDNPAELKARISELEDQILALRISKLKDFGDYLEKNKELKKDLDANINYGIKEIERLENKLKSINRKKLELEQKLGEAQSKNAKLEIKLINAENKEENITPTPNWWIDYGPIILMVGLYFFSVWLLNKNAKYNNNYGN
ncbi:MAG: hypothetical protein MRERV_32c013 [Mycoplasmataceae bacterium RV_VA103A]|nr:MAG: hypothetical protein MRERV_32c013 [Mycoplasmataceae bacterium RV_VA103A]